MIYGFLMHRHTKTLIKYLQILKDRPCSVKEISEKLGHRDDSILNALRKEKYQRYVGMAGNGINKNPYIISITPEGDRFLKLINSLRGILKHVEEEMANELPFETVKREIIVKKEAKSVHGCKPEERKVEDLIKLGVVCVNKPQGPTSHQISDYVKKIFSISKAGHSGTLE
jgi:hypothetical protein